MLVGLGAELGAARTAADVVDRGAADTAVLAFAGGAGARAVGAIAPVVALIEGGASPVSPFVVVAAGEGEGGGSPAWCTEDPPESMKRIGSGNESGEEPLTHMPAAVMAAAPAATIEMALTTARGRLFWRMVGCVTVAF